MIFFNEEKDECIVPRSNVYSSPEILGGIHKNFIALNILVMRNKFYNLLATDKKANG